MTGYKSATITTFSRLTWQDSEFRYVILAPMLDFCIPKWVSLQAVAAIRNMALQHHEFELRLRDANGCDYMSSRNGRAGDAECFIKGG